MTGYNYQSGMSNNAVEAYSNGIKPLSQFTVADLKAAGWTETKKLAISLAHAGVWHTSEYHHSGGTWYNRVDFYNPADLIEAWNDLEPAEQAEFTATKKIPAEEKSQRVTGHYAVWGGSRSHPRKLYDENFTGTLAGNWIHLDNGGKKKAAGNHISWENI